MADTSKKNLFIWEIGYIEGGVGKDNGVVIPGNIEHLAAAGLEIKTALGLESYISISG